MNLWAKILATGALGAAAFKGWSYMKDLKSAQAELQVIPKVSLYQLAWDGITIRIDVTLKNPTKASFSVKFPFVTLIYKGTTVGTSQAIDKDFKLPKFGEVIIDKILVRIPLTSAFSVVFGLVKALFNHETVTLTIRTLTHINLGWVVLPYENSKQVKVSNS